MVTIIAKSYYKEICFQTAENFWSITHFNKTVCLLTEPARRLHCLQVKLQTSFRHLYGLRTVRTENDYDHDKKDIPPAKKMKT